MILLISIVFFLSWLPLNTLNTALHFRPDLIQEKFGGQVGERKGERKERRQGGREARDICDKIKFNNF
jgi:hypothetical protein